MVTPQPMPSHFTHLLFAEEALRNALGPAAKEILDRHGPLFRFGAQGPDFFYHNQRTKPYGIRYGVFLHRSGYGRMVAHMTAEAHRLRAVLSSELGAFLLGFATHASLDRMAHPYIAYFSGWVDPKKPETKRLFRCHAFLERILDVLVLERRFGLSLVNFDFYSLVDCGRTLPYGVVKALVKGLNATYPAMDHKSRDRNRVENAYRDTRFFYRLTNHLNPRLIELAYRKDRKEGFTQRRLALVHPWQVPANIDFLNTARAEWRHPCDPGTRSRAGFLELYDLALDEAVKDLKMLVRAIDQGASLGLLAEEIGDEDLDTGREHCAPVFSAPLPLPEALAEMYRSLENETAAL
jgi:hypothetical protein